ncbi:MAG: flavin reductase family protein [Crocinitomicaceae bacterium]|nr:flavin reductase family protein [Crocinitomicaceae bacterium]MBT6515592.1 flavin reductase family protein [Crocinitomicaceae bacterium]
MLTIDPKEIPVPKLHHYLLGSVGPRPICFASTIDKNGVPNIAPFSFFNVFSANPPIAVFSPARSGRTNQSKDTFNNVTQVPEVVINIVNYNLVHQMTLASSPYGAEIDEFIKSGLTPVPSDKIQPFRIKESPVQMECKVVEIKELGDQGGAGNLIICEIVKIHIDESVLDSNNMVDQEKIDLVARMGGNWYCRANKASMFEIEKPITKCGIGLDSIPVEIIQSTVLSGNDLGQLGGIESLPNETDVNDYKLITLSDVFIQYEDDAKSLELELHRLAKKLLENNKIEEAWMALLAFNN